MSYDLSKLETSPVTRPPRIILCGVEKIGKALHVDTEVAVPGGFVPLADIKPGDTVFDLHAMPTKVKHVTGVMLDRPCFRLNFQSGSEVIADADHQWLVLDINHNECRILTTLQLADSGVTKGSRPLFAVPICKGTRSLMYLVAVEPCPSVPVKCFEVDSPTHTYLVTRHYIPTHNSTFAAGAPSPVFLPINGEEGIDDLAVARVPTCESLDDVLNALRALSDQKHEFETVVIDSVSTLEPLVWDAVCRAEGVDSIEKVGGGFGKGYIEAVGRWRLLMAALDTLRAQGMASILIGHVTVRTFADPTTESYDQYQLDLNRHAAAALMRWSDCILFANARALVRKDEAGFNKTNRKAVLRDERCLFTHKRPAHPGGGRGLFGRLPYELPLEWTAFEEAITQAKEKADE